MGDEVGGTMIERKLNIAEIMLIAGTRVALRAGRRDRPVDFQQVK
jgi:hypothetical protein